MSFQRLPLRKLLKLFYMSPSQLQTATRKEIRDKIKKLKAKTGDKRKGRGGDFYSEFWSDAKRHILGEVDISEATVQRIQKNANTLQSKGKLYPLLLKGFLSWWNDKRRWSNQSITLVEKSPSALISIDEVGAMVRLENLLAIEIGNARQVIIYPYFNKDFALSGEAARLGLWLLGEAFSEIELSDIRILDVYRGNSFTVSDVPLVGDEKELFLSNYKYLLRKWEELSLEYDWP